MAEDAGRDWSGASYGAAMIEGCKDYNGLENAYDAILNGGGVVLMRTDNDHPFYKFVTVREIDPALPIKSNPSTMAVRTFAHRFGKSATSTIHERLHIRYFDLLEKDSLATPAVADYRLCAYLIDKKLSDFVAYLPQYYDMNGSLPKFYREALTLYVHSTKNPSIDFSHEVMNEDWENFQSLVKAVKNKTENDVRLYEQYSNSYWYYYFYQ
jgi:hypothetical protein